MYFRTGGNIMKQGLLLAACFFSSLCAHARSNEDVEKILKQVELRAAPPSERVDLEMTIQEADGAKKTRELTILRKNDRYARALVRLQKPADLRGLTLLTMTEGSKEEQYLYLPSDKKARRILGSNKKGKFLDSEIAYEDMAISTYKEYMNKIAKDDGKTITIVSKIKKRGESSYGRIITWISKADFRIQRVDYFDRTGRLLKRAEFSDYQKIGDKYWRAREVNVRNAQNNRRTKLHVKHVSLKTIDEGEVSLAALED